MPPPESFEIRRLCKEDFSNWKTLWCQYLKFYKSSVDNVVYETTFKRLISNQHTYQNALVAAQENSLIGLAHYIYHPHNWKIEDVCYLQDLFVIPTIRGIGVGRTLIEAVYSASDENKTPTVYWLTQDFNKQARRLYDNIGSLTPFIKYNRY
jgi:GNAT superfamily N-acetyltransferase|tara:strand:- start:2223 stop:2678 length:456 start_codon:yes stop_codon:yes gene_type:complete